MQEKVRKERKVIGNKWDKQKTNKIGRPNAKYTAIILNVSRLNTPIERQTIAHHIFF